MYGMKDMADRVRAYLGGHGLSGAGTVRADGDRVRWGEHGELSLVDYGEFCSVERVCAGRDYVGDTVEGALDEYYGSVPGNHRAVPGDVSSGVRGHRPVEATRRKEA